MMAFTKPCPRCGKALPQAAGFCDGCGARMDVAPAAPAPAVMSARPGFVAAGRGLSVCHGCGAIAPVQRTTCAICGAAIGTSLEAVPPRADGARFVQVQTTLTCRTCASPTPIDPLDDEPIQCGRCSTVQAIDEDAWREMLAHAHAVADLAGLDPARAGLPANPHASIGTEHTSATLRREGMQISGGVMRTRNTAISAAPGHPLCTACGSPLEAVTEGEGAATRCPGCGDIARYRMPPTIRARAPGLELAIADDHRTDRPEAQLHATSAGMVVALRCPGCGGNLEVAQGAHFATCQFCKTSARIPSRTLLALKKDAPDAPRWWLLFSGESAARRDMLGARGAAIGDDDEDDEDDDDDRPRRRRRPRGGTGLELPEGESTPREEQIAWALQITVPLAMLGLVTVVFFGGVLLEWVRHLAPGLVP